MNPDRVGESVTILRGFGRENGAILGRVRYGDFGSLKETNIFFVRLDNGEIERAHQDNLVPRADASDRRENRNTPGNPA